MRYFTLHIIRPNGDELLKTDFLVEQFELFAHNIFRLLSKEKLVKEEEQYSIRFIPQTGSTLQLNKATMAEVDEAVDYGSNKLEIYFEKNQRTIKQCDYLTLQIHAKESRRVFRIDIEPDLLLTGLLTNAAQVLLDENRLKDGDHFHFTISAHDKGRRPRKRGVISSEIDTAEPSTPIVKITSREAAPSEPPPTSEAGAAASKHDDLNIIIGPVENMVKCETRTMKSYTDTEVIGVVAPDELPIFVRRGAMEEARKFARAKTNEEVGGFLIGNIFREPDSERLFVEISQVVEANQAQGTYVELNFTHEAWRQVIERLEREFTDKFLLGWYHTHLVSQVTIQPVPDSKREYSASYKPFFSRPDLFIHRHFFANPWQVALVLDLHCKKEAFFAWGQSDVVPTQGFYLYGN